MTKNPVVCGLLAGAAGVVAMTAAEKLEQQFTGRPDSYVPGRTLKRLLGKRPEPQETPLAYSWIMHWSQGIALGALRGYMAKQGLRGPFGSFLLWNLRLLNDQTFENMTGVGAPPWTWPVDEQIIDIVHKGVYAFTTGWIADRLIAGPEGIPEPRLPWAERRVKPIG